MQAAELKVRLNRSEEALKDFEAMLGKLRPDSWLHKEVRRKIEEVFLRNDDRAGLVTYYEKWTKRDPEDVEALVRLGRTLAMMGRIAEAQPWYEKAIKLAPGRRDLRLALIGQLAAGAEVRRGRRAVRGARPRRAEQPRHAPRLGHPRDAGREPARGRAQGRRRGDLAEAARDQAQRPGDHRAGRPTCMRQAELVDDALALYRKAIEHGAGQPPVSRVPRRVPPSAQAARRGDGRVVQDRRGAEPDREEPGPAGRGAGRLRLRQGGDRPAEEAVELDKDDFDLRMKLAELSHRLEQFADAEVQLAVGGRGWRARTRRRRPCSRRGSRTTRRPAGSPRGSPRCSRSSRAIGARRPAGWSELARYLEADGKLPDAVRAADRAVQVEPRSVPAWALAARLRESAGNLGDAADALRRLAEVDRKNRAEYLTGIARLESRLGRVDAAIKAGRDLLAAAPGNPEHYEFFSQLCFQLGRSEEGLDALRRAVRVNSNDTKIILTLAENLAGMYRTEEAIEMYWRAFDKAEDLDAKLGVVSRMTELYLQRNQFDRLLTRLQHQDRDARPERRASRSSATWPSAWPRPTPRRATWAPPGADRAAPGHQRARHQAPAPALQAGRGGGRPRERRPVPEAAQRPGRHRRGRHAGSPSSTPGTASSRRPRRSGRRWPPTRASRRTASSRRSTACWGTRRPQPVAEITASMVRKEPGDWEALFRQGEALADARQARGGRAGVPRPARAAGRRRREERHRQGADPRPQAPEPGRAAVVGHPQGHDAAGGPPRRGRGDPRRQPPRG